MASEAQAKIEECEANIVKSLSLLPILQGSMHSSYIFYTSPSIKMTSNTVIICPQMPLHIPRVDGRIHDTCDV